MKKITQFLCFLFFSFNGEIPAQNNTISQKTKAFPFGVIETITSKELSENRTVNIYLPDGYNSDSTATYPVIYLLDGSANEDFIPTVGLVYNFSFPWIKTLPPSIVVGIANVDRKRDFSFASNAELDKKEYPTSGGSEKFIAFIEKELQPFIEKKYKTTPSKTIIGQLFGGLLVTTILLTKPQLFNKYIIISPSLWWNNGSLLLQQGTPESVAKLNFLPGTKIYIGVGKEGAMPGRRKFVMQSVAEELAMNLKKSNNKNILIFFDYLPNETHGTVAHQAVCNAFKLLSDETK